MSCSNGSIGQLSPYTCSLGRDAPECMVCRIVIEVGEIEYELPLGGVTAFVHRRCFMMWRAVISGDDPA